MDRRSFLTTLSALLASQGLAGCSRPPKPTLTIQVLKDSIPAQLVGRFRQWMQQSAPLDFDLSITPEAQLEGLFTLLQTLKQKAPELAQAPTPQPRFPWGGNGGVTVPDWVTLGDYWLSVAIRQGLIQPLAIADLKSWQHLPPPWQALVQRDRQGNPAANGEIWAAPYRWGSTLIAYRADKFREAGLAPPQDWADLWRPELRDKISLPDQPREVIGLTLKKLGQSYNSPDLVQIPDLKPTLRALHQQAKLYSSKAYLQPLVLGETWVAVGWSPDILPLVQSDSTAYAADKRRLAAVIPPSGTAL